MAGICTLPPVGGIVIPVPRGIKTFNKLPVAYYSLSTPALRAWPYSVASGTSRGTSFRHDPEFGSVLHCKQGMCHDPPYNLGNHLKL